MDERPRGLENANRIRDLFFSHLLGGGAFPNRATLLAESVEAEAELPYPYFIVLAAQPTKWGELFDLEEEDTRAMDRRDLNFIMRNVLENGFGQETLVRAATYRGQMVAVLNLPVIPDAGVRSVVWDAKQLLSVLEEQFDLTLVVAISRIYNDVEEVAAAYVDTTRIFDYLQVTGLSQQVTSYEELTHTHLAPSATRYLQMEGKMLSCIQVSDYEGLRHIIHEMVTSEFEQTRPTIDIFHFRVYGIVNSFLYMMDEIKGNVGEAFYNQLDPGPRLCGAATLNELMLEIDEILDELSVFAAEQKKGTRPGWLVKLKDYVDENYTDMNVTVGFVADLFGVGASHCSRGFKQHYGVGLFDYIQRLRLEKAKSLMKEDMSVKAIAEASGFSSGLTMNRAFKRYEGTTPSKFREAAWSGQETDG